MIKRRKPSAQRRFEARAGHTYAIDPRAFFDFFMEPETRENQCVGNVEIVDIDGPLEQHAGGWCDSYEAIRARVQVACDGEARAIVLRIDSPGGDCAGCFETARAIRAMCALVNKPLYTYVTDKACSAGYALAAAASSITLGDSAIVGSIGVLSTREDVSAMLALRGVRVALIASGARKADGHPESPLTDDELAATQTVVDSVATVFFALVEELRGVPALEVAALQAAVFHGESAISARLADNVGSFDSFLAAIAEGTIMATAYEKARASLQEAAEGDDANAAAAKRALAAMDEGTEPEKKDDAAEGDDADKEAEHAEPDGDEKAESDDEPDGDEPPAEKKKEARGMSSELSAMAEVHKLRAEIAADRVAVERKALVASRKDFAPELVTTLLKASTPIATVRDLVKTLPKGPVVKPPSAKGGGTAAVAGVRGESQGGTEVTAASEVQLIDRAMGMTTTAFGTRREGNHALVLGVMEKKIEKPVAVSGAVGGVK